MPLVESIPSDWLNCEQQLERSPQLRNKELDGISKSTKNANLDDTSHFPGYRWVASMGGCDRYPFSVLIRSNLIPVKSRLFYQYDASILRTLVSSFAEMKYSLVGTGSNLSIHGLKVS